MSEKESFDPDREKEFALEYKKRIAELFEIGLDSNDIYAWHGTTIEAIQHLARTGKLPASGSYGAELFYVPEGIGSHEGDQQHAEVYAQWNATKYYILERLKFKPGDMEKFMYMFDDDKLLNEFIHEAMEHGMDKKDVRHLIREAEVKRKGVLVTLSKRMKEDFEEKADVADDQRSVITSDGLPLDYITGIEPLGQYEWEELEKLQQEDE